MKDGNVNEFLDKILYQEEAVMFHGQKYFFNPGYMENEKIYDLQIEIWDEHDQFIKQVFYSKGQTQNDNLNKFLETPIWDGKTFWQAESEMTWIDW